MPRNSGGTYTLPGSPVVTGTSISSADTNQFRNDVASEITSSLDRSGRGAMLAALSLYASGTKTLPSLTFGGDGDTGLYLIGANNPAISAGDTKIQEWSTTGTTIVGNVTLTASAPQITLTTANTKLDIFGNRAAADAGADVRIGGNVTRTAGTLVDFANNGTNKLQIDFAGQIKWPSGPASTATTPAPSAVTAPTPAANWTASLGLGYWTDPMNIIHLHGCATAAAGAGQTIFTLPAGFRPAFQRDLVGIDQTAGTVAFFIVNTTGTVQTSGAPVAGRTYEISGITFLAEA